MKALNAMGSGRAAVSMIVMQARNLAALRAGGTSNIPKARARKLTWRKTIINRFYAYVSSLGGKRGMGNPPQGRRGGDHEMVLPRIPCTKT
ncbi:MAG: hypothetical protein AB2801_09835 [Candidatus Thiodiazotropha endolucinida]